MNKELLLEKAESEILQLTKLVYDGFREDPNPSFKRIKKITLPLVEDPEYNLSYVNDENYIFIDRHSSELAEISCWSPKEYGPKIFKSFNFSKATDISFIRLTIKEIYSEMIDILLKFSLSRAFDIIEYEINNLELDLNGPYLKEYYGLVCPGLIDLSKLISENKEFLEDKYGVIGLNYDNTGWISWLRYKDEKVEKEKRELVGDMDESDYRFSAPYYDETTPYFFDPNMTTL